MGVTTVGYDHSPFVRGENTESERISSETERVRSQGQRRQARNEHKVGNVVWRETSTESRPR